RRHTRCLSDWSSDVCSSDLQFLFIRHGTFPRIWQCHLTLGWYLSTISYFPRRLSSFRFFFRSSARSFALLRCPVSPLVFNFAPRSEERRVGKECRSRLSACG